MVLFHFEFFLKIDGIIPDASVTQKARGISRDYRAARDARGATPLSLSCVSFLFPYFFFNPRTPAIEEGL